MSGEKSREFKKAFGRIGIDRNASVLQAATKNAIQRLDEAIFQAQLDDPFYGLHTAEIDEMQKIADKLRYTPDIYTNEDVLAKAKLRAEGQCRLLDALRASDGFASVASIPQVRNTKLQEIGDAMDEHAATAQDKGFLIAAIKARFGITTMCGDLGVKSLLRLYDLLDGLPEGHTAFNDKLKNIQRSKEKGTSSFDTIDTIEINAGDLRPDNTKTYETVGGELNLDSFDSTTLHEIGHSVDYAVNYMVSKRGIDAYGGWKQSSLQEVIDVGVTNFNRSWKDGILTDEEIRMVVTSLVTSGRLDQEVLKKHANEANLEQRLLNDSTAIWCCQVWSRSGTMRFASKDDAKKVSIDQRVYIRNGTDWWTYALAARDSQVSNYQFSAPPEWFAEVYSMFMLGKLPTSHPCFAEISKLDGRKPLA